MLSHRKPLKGFFPTLSIFLLTATSVLFGQFDPVGELVWPETVNGRWVAEKDGYVYTLDMSYMLRVFNGVSLSEEGPFTTLSSPVRQLDLEFAYGIVRHGNYLYAFGGGIQVIDISNPGNPVLGNKVGAEGLRNAIVYENEMIGVGSDVLCIYGLASPANPALVASTTLEGRSGFAVGACGEYIYVGELGSSYYGRRVVHRTGPGTLSTLSTTQLSEDCPYHYLMTGSYLIECSTSTVRLLSVVDPAHPSELDSVIASARAAVLWQDKIVTNGKVFKINGIHLEEYSSFTPVQSQHDGMPHGATAGEDFIYITQRRRVLVLNTAPALIFPQYANGSGGGHQNTTRIVLWNLESTGVTGRVLFRTQSGESAQLAISGQLRSEVPYSIPARGTFEVSTDGTGNLGVGPVEVYSSGTAALCGSEVFRLMGYPVSIQDSPPRKVHQAYVSVKQGENTGVAVYNPSLASAAQLRFWLFDNTGTQRGVQTMEIPPRTHRAVFVTEPALFAAFFSGTTTAFQGTLNITVLSGPAVAVTTLIQASPSGALMAMPTVGVVGSP